MMLDVMVCEGETISLTTISRRLCQRFLYIPQHKNVSHSHC